MQRFEHGDAAVNKSVQLMGPVLLIRCSPFSCSGIREAEQVDTTENFVTEASRHAPLQGLARRHYFYTIATMKSQDAIAALSALASEARLAVFRLLVRRGPAGYTPTELTRRLGVPAPTLSFHLRELINAELVTSRRVGRHLFYSPNLERMNTLVRFLTEHCCALADEACGPNCKPLAAPPQVITPAKQRKRTPEASP